MEREAADGYFVRVCNNGDTFATNCLKWSINDYWNILGNIVPFKQYNEILKILTFSEEFIEA